MNIQNKIEQLKQNGYHLDFSDTFSEAFELWKKVFGYGIVAFVVSIIFSQIVSMLIGFIPAFSGLNESFMNDILENQQDPEKMLLIYKDYFMNPLFLGSIFISKIVSCFIFPISVGMIFLTKNYDEKGIADFGDLFKGFQGNLFFKLVLLYLIFSIVLTIASFTIIGGIFIWIGFILAAPFIIFEKMDIFQAIKASFVVVYKNPLQIFLVMFVSWLFSISGLIVCCIGVAFTICFMPILSYVLYKNIVGFDESSEIDQIGLQ